MTISQAAHARCAIVGVVRQAAALIVWIIVSSVAGCSQARAQEHVTVQSDAIFYGDDTEFRNPFREGETIFGSAIRIAAAVDLNDRVRVSLGAFGNLRFGGDDAFEQARPVVSLMIAGKSSSFIFGTLATPTVGTPPGPDRTGPHGLLPPLQRETLAFERPYEAGIQWKVHTAAIRNDLWINWQRLNTAEHRERFDAGTSASFALSRLVAVPLQLHIVHEGGQLFASGPVADSVALASGLDVHGKVAHLDSLAFEAYGLVSRFVPDRATPARSQTGGAMFLRASAEGSGWRGHLIVWRGFDYLKEEGDPNYQSMTRDGVRYRGTRDYSELGLTRTFTPAPGVIFEASGRLHRIERYYEYSFRIVATASFGWKLR
jgi:hypothetical protein